MKMLARAIFVAALLTANYTFAENMPVIAYKISGQTECVLIGAKHYVFSKPVLPPTLIAYANVGKTLFVESSYNDGIAPPYFSTSFKKSDNYLQITSNESLRSLRSEFIRKRNLKKMTAAYEDEPVLDIAPPLVYAQYILTLGRAMWGVPSKLEPSKNIDLLMFDYSIRNKYDLRVLEYTDTNYRLLDTYLKTNDKFVEYFRDIYNYAQSDAAYASEHDLEAILKTQDTNQIENHLKKIYFEYPLLSRENTEILEERNQIWLPKILDYLSAKNKQCVIAVGAAHLVGPNGLVTLLGNAGVRVEQISNSFDDLQR